MKRQKLPSPSLPGPELIFRIRSCDRDRGDVGLVAARYVKGGWQGLGNGLQPISHRTKSLTSFRAGGFKFINMPGRAGSL